MTEFCARSHGVINFETARRGPSSPDAHSAILPVLDVIASVAFTAFGNVSGLAAASLPLHWTEEGRPLAGGQPDQPLRPARAGDALG
jgi:hypothetical protein